MQAGNAYNFWLLVQLLYWTGVYSNSWDKVSEEHAVSFLPFTLNILRHFLGFAPYDVCDLVPFRTVIYFPISQFILTRGLIRCNNTLLSSTSILKIMYTKVITIYLIKLIWRIKKYDWSWAVTLRIDKSSCLPQVSLGTALRRLVLWRHSTYFTRQVSFTENEKAKWCKASIQCMFPWY